MSASRRVVVLGAGLSGLTCAWDVLRRAERTRRPVEVTVLEASGRAGGNLVSDRVEGCVIDGGADAWVSAKAHATELCKDLGLGAELIATIERNRRVYIAHKGVLIPLPAGLMMGVPSDLGAMLRSPIVSPRGKLRMALDLCLPRGDAAGDESLGALVERRLGREAVEALTEPILGGIYGGDPWRLSALAVAPQLVEMERTARSLVLGTLAKRRATGALRGSGSPSMFTSLKNGTGSLVEALKNALPEGVLRVNTRARSLRRADGGWSVITDAGDAHFAHDVVVALPTHAAARVLSEASPEGCAALSTITHSSAATVFFAFPRASVKHPLDGTGFIVPRREGRGIMAATWVSSKWPGRAPEGVALMRAFVGDRNRALEGDDAALTALSLGELGRFLRIDEKPLWTRVFRFMNASPQPEVGHAEKLARIHRAMHDLPGLHLTGASYEGVGIPDCVRHARAVAARLTA